MHIMPHPGHHKRQRTERAEDNHGRNKIVKLSLSLIKRDGTQATSLSSSIDTSLQHLTHQPYPHDHQPNHDDNTKLLTQSSGSGHHSNNNTSTTSDNGNSGNDSKNVKTEDDTPFIQLHIHIQPISPSLTTPYHREKPLSSIHHHRDHTPLTRKLMLNEIREQKHRMRDENHMKQTGSPIQFFYKQDDAFMYVDEYNKACYMSKDEHSHSSSSGSSSNRKNETNENNTSDHSIPIDDDDINIKQSVHTDENMNMSVYMNSKDDNVKLTNHTIHQAYHGHYHTYKVVWSEELSYQQGKRRYLTASYQDFYHYYIYSLKPYEHHHYEIIRDNEACHLYLDIEWKIVYNPHLDLHSEQGDKMVKVFLDFLFQELYLYYQCILTYEDIVILDSSHGEKFSRHVICHIDKGNSVFLSNVHVGRFVAHVCKKIEREVMDDHTSVLRELYIYTDHMGSHKNSANYEDDSHNRLISTSNRSLPIDLSVYSKNRCFRLYMSSKAPYSVQLPHARPQRRNKLKPSVCCQFDTMWYYHRQHQMGNACSEKQNDIDKEKVYFFASLASNVDRNQVKKYLTYDEEDGNPRGSKPHSHVIMRVDNKMKDRVNHIDPSLNASMKSRFTRLHEYMVAYVAQWGNKGGTIKSIIYMNIHHKEISDNETSNVSYDALGDTVSTICYSVIGDRYCANLARQHKSNHIYFLVSIDQHTVKQRCYDYDCTNFSSQPVPIPEYIFHEDEADDIDWQSIDLSAL